MPEITYMHLEGRINNPQARIEPVGIILHYIGNPGTSAKANANYFAHVNSQVSVNYIVDDNEIIEIIPPYMKSYGTSSGEYNGKYIQIEMCHKDAAGVISEGTLENTVWLCRKLIGEYGCRDIIRHYDVTGKICPKWYVEHPNEWEALRARILKEEEEMDNTPSDWAKEAVSWALGNGLIHGDQNGNLSLHENVSLEKLLVILKRYDDAK